MVIFHGYVSHNQMVYRVDLETGSPNWASQLPCFQPLHRWTPQLLLLFQLIESRNDEPSALILGCCSPPLNADKRQQAPYGLHYGFVWKLAACNPNSHGFHSQCKMVTLRSTAFDNLKIWLHGSWPSLSDLPLMDFVGRATKLVQATDTLYGIICICGIGACRTNTCIGL